MSPRLFDPPTETVLANGARIVNCEQHSQEWYSARLGIPTASRLSCIVTSQAKPSKGETRETYKHKLIVERLTRHITMGHQDAAMERGTLLEPQARAYYEVVTGNAVREAGFVRSECGRWGGSPDGLVMDGDKCAGGIEVKCLLNHNVVKYILRHKGKVPAEFVSQIQGNLWITGADWWDWVLFTDAPEIPNLICRVLPDMDMHGAFDVCVPAFAEEIDNGVRAITEANQ